MMSEKIIIPISIIVSGLIIGIAIIFVGNQPVPVQIDNSEQNPAAASVEVKRIDPVTDHIDGNSSADIFVIEYSDLECPFCKQYHNEALKNLKEHYADNDEVAFVFRHFPLDEPYTSPIHPTATEAHIAATCVAKLGGNDAFFTFIDDMFNADDSTDLTKLSQRAVDAGVDKNAFDVCYNNKDTEPLVTASFNEGAAAGVQGTPTIFLQTKDGNTFPAIPDFEGIKVGIDAYFSEN